MLHCSPERDGAGQHCRLNRVPGAWLLNFDSRLGSSIPQQICILLHCSIWKALHRCGEGHVDDDQAARHRCAHQRMPSRPSVLYGRNVCGICLRSFGAFVSGRSNPPVSLQTFNQYDPDHSVSCRNTPTLPTMPTALTHQVGQLLIKLFVGNMLITSSHSGRRVRVPHRSADL